MTRYQFSRDHTDGYVNHSQQSTMISNTCQDWQRGFAQGFEGLDCKKYHPKEQILVSLEEYERAFSEYKLWFKSHVYQTTQYSIFPIERQNLNQIMQLLDSYLKY